MIDLHCHILPGLDDGPKNEEESLLMARAAVLQGIHTIVATPHHQTVHYMNEKKDIVYAVGELNDLLKQKDIPLTILPGQEVRIYGDLLQDYDTDIVETLNETNKYILLEFPSSHVPRYTKTLLYDMQLKGLIPVLAHPERNAEIAEHPSVLYELISKGALAQLTASSLTGDFGKSIKKLSLQLIEHNLVHVVASDAHNVTNRPFKLKESYDVIQDEFGIDMRSLFQEQAYSIVNGHAVFKQEPQELRRKKLFGIF
ncbi:tyrosine-protein phosphatase [Ectobacillus sp. sgz5001026]|uniref:tyrosine-protein phosphatase n=1 Tax=Ectobacillus sp. sgz5001026 TaxID=3242473 RepID=UPI0036D2A1D2